MDFAKMFSKMSAEFFQIYTIYPTCFGCFLLANTTRPATFEIESETRPETFETETRKNGSVKFLDPKTRSRDSITNPYAGGTGPDDQPSFSIY